jgi:hypothetical protein
MRHAVACAIAVILVALSMLAVILWGYLVETVLGRPHARVILWGWWTTMLTLAAIVLTTFIGAGGV